MKKNLLFLALFYMVLQPNSIFSLDLVRDLTTLKNNLTNLYNELKKIPSAKPEKEDQQVKEIKQRIDTIIDALAYQRNQGTVVDAKDLDKFEGLIREKSKNLNKKQKDSINEYRHEEVEALVEELKVRGLIQNLEEEAESSEEEISSGEESEEEEEEVLSGEESGRKIEPTQQYDFPENPELEKLLKDDYERLEDFKEKISLFQEKLDAFFKWAKKYTEGKQDRNFLPPAFHELMQQFNKLPSAANILHLIDELNKFKQDATSKDAIAAIELLINLGNYLRYLVNLINNGWDVNHDILKSGIWSYNNKILNGAQHYMNNLLNYAHNIKSIFLEESGGRVLRMGERTNEINYEIRSWRMLVVTPESTGPGYKSWVAT